MTAKNMAPIPKLLGIVALMFVFGTATAFGEPVDGGEYDATHIIVLEPGADLASVARNHRIDVKLVYSNIFNGFSGAVFGGRLSSLKNDPRVAMVEPNMVFPLLDQVVPTGVDRIDADLNPTANLNGVNEALSVVVGVMDSGVQGDHPDLNVNVEKSADCTKRGPCKTGVAIDSGGHGTHVAGTIGALDNGIGVVGVAPGAEIWSIKVCQAGCNLDHILKGHDYVSANADTIAVLNLSLGGSGWSEIWRAAIKDNVEKGVIVVVAAGNANADIYGGDGTIGDGNEIIPAAFPEAATISALADSDGRDGGVGPDTVYGPDDTLASFSNFSATVVADNSVISPGAAIDCAAPGVDILSTFKGGAYALLSGTSMASPHAAGSAALYVVANGRPVDAAGVAAARQALIDGCQPTASWRTDAADTDSDPDANHEGMVHVAPVASLAHDVGVTAINAPASAVKGDIVTIDVAIENKGINEETFDLVLRDLTDSITIGTQPVTLVAGAATTMGFLWATADASLGDHSLEAEAVLTTDDNTDNNKMGIVVSVQSPVADIAVTLLSAPVSLDKGDTTTVDVTVENVGNQDVIADIVVTLVDDTDGVTIGQQMIPGGLTPSASATLTFSWVTTDASLGDHVLTASHGLGDDDATNNSLSTTMTLNEAKPSLNVAVTTDKEVIDNKDNVKITVTVADFTNRVAGAAVHLVVSTPNGNKLASNGTTDDQGEIEFRVRVNTKRDGCGRFIVDATAFKDGFNAGSGLVTIDATC